MRRLFIFAVLWTALFGSGHVLAACPMGLAADHGTHAPCHSDGHRGTAVEHGHDCCAWVAPSTTSGKFFIQKSSGPFSDLAQGEFAAAVAVPSWHAPPLTHPPPLAIWRYALRSAVSGGDTFLRTGRLRL